MSSPKHDNGVELAPSSQSDEIVIRDAYYDEKGSLGVMGAEGVGVVPESELQEEEETTTHRNLKSRHVSMIAIGVSNVPRYQVQLLALVNIHH